MSESFSPERYGKVINCQVITESGQLLGRVLGFSFDIETGDLISLVMGAVGVPLLGEGVLSTWEIPVEEIVSSGTDRIIVYEGAEEKLNQLSSGLLEKLGVGGSSWDEREANGYTLQILYLLRISYFQVLNQNSKTIWSRNMKKLLNKMIMKRILKRILKMIMKMNLNMLK